MMINACINCRCLLRWIASSGICFIVVCCNPHQTLVAQWADSSAGNAVRMLSISDSTAMHSWASYYRTTITGRPITDTTVIRPFALAMTAGVYTSAIVALHLYQANAWWSNNRTSFHLAEDWGENLQNDKFGHFFGGYLLSYAHREALLASGLSDQAAHHWGATMGLLYQTYVEIEDGYAGSWGFSPSDALSNLAGASFFLGQYHIPFLRNFRPKWTYFPSQFLGGGSIPGQKRTFIDDYQGQSFWWAIDVWNLLPESLQRDYPKWLQLSAGYIAKKYSPYRPGIDSDLPDTREFYIGLDYSLSHLLPVPESSLLRWLLQTSEYIRLPAPALRIYPEPRLFILFPFKMSL